MSPDLPVPFIPHPSSLIPHPSQLVIFIDEIDVVRSLPFSTDEFFAAIRHCYNRRTDDPEFERLTFCLFGVATPSDLIRDTRMTPFNIGRRIDLHDFTPEEASHLRAGLEVGGMETRGRPEPEARALLARVLYWTGGHPYLTQRLCQAVAEDGEVRDAPGVDRHCRELFLAHGAATKDDNLLFVRERLLKSEADLAGLLDLYRRVRAGWHVRDDDTNPLCGILRLSGVARLASGFLRVRNRIYDRVFDREWVKEHMPDAELRRQQAAFRRGVGRTSAMAGAVLLVMGALTGWAVRQQQRAEERTREERRTRYAAEMNLAAQAWQGGNVAQVERLLEKHRPQQNEEDLRGFEWRHLWWLCHAGDPLRFLGHTDRLSSVAVSPDGRTLATTSGDGTVRLWEVASRRPLEVLEGHQGWVHSVAFSPDGKTLASGGADGTVRLWETGTGRAVDTLKSPGGAVQGVAFSPNGKTLAAARAGARLTLWNLATRQPASLPTGPGGGAHCVAFSPDGRRLAAGLWSSHVQLWDPFSRRRLADFKAPIAMIASVSFSPDGRTLAAGGVGDTITLWDLARGREVAAFRAYAGGTVPELAFSPDGRSLATAGTDATVRLWDLRDGIPRGRRPPVLRATLRGHRNVVETLAFLPDGRGLVTGSADRTARLWERSALEPEGSAERQGEVGDLDFSPNGRTLASTNFDASLVLWRLTPGGSARPGPTFRPVRGHFHRAAFSPDGRLLAATMGDRQRPASPGEVWLLDVAQGRRARRLSLPKRPLSVAFSPDGRLLAVGMIDDQGSWLWDTRTWQPVRRLLSGAWVLALAFSPDGGLLASSDSDGRLRLWEVATGQQKWQIDKGHAEGAWGLAFSSDGSLLASASVDRTTKLWEVASGRQVGASLAGHTGIVSAVVFSPDGTTLATGSYDGTVKLWRLGPKIDVEVATFPVPEGTAQTLALSPDGSTLAVAGTAGRLWLWHAPALRRIDTMDP